MNRTLASALAVSVLALAAGQALAADKTRDQVTAEYLEAVRTGNIVAGIDGHGNQKLNEIFPGSYPTQTEAAGKTRAEVSAEYFQAVRTGNIVSTVDGYGNQKLNEVFPGSYPAQAKTGGKTRAEVNAELTQALRSGALNQQVYY